MLFRVHHEREGKGTLDAPGVWATHIADGKITEIWSFPFDQAATKEIPLLRQDLVCGHADRCHRLSR